MIGMGDGGTLYLQLHGTFGICWTKLILHTFCVLPIKSDTCYGEGVLTRNYETQRGKIITTLMGL